MNNLIAAKSILKKVIDGISIDSPELMKQMEPIIASLKKRQTLSGEVKKKEKKIALIIPYHPLYEIGGLEIGTRKIAKGLMRLGNDVEIISKGAYPDKDLTGRKVCPEGIFVTGIGSGIEEIIPYVFDRYSEFEIIQWMEIFPPIPEMKTVYNDKAEKQYLSSIILRSLGLKTFLYVATSGNVTNRGVNNKNWGVKNQRLNEYLELGMNGFNMINSEIIKEYKDANINIKNERYEIIYLGVDTNKFKPVNKEKRNQLRKELKLPRDKIIFICPGRFVRRKKQDLLFGVWQQLPENVKNKTHLLFVGGKAGQGQPDSIYEGLKNKIVSYLDRRDSQGKVADITCVDLVSREVMIKHFQSSDVMLFPSEREGLGMVVLEAMACGKPVFASDISGVREIIKSPIIGTLLQPNDNKELEGCIFSFLNSPGEYTKKALRARAYVVDNWSWESICKKLDIFYNKF